MFKILAPAAHVHEENTRCGLCSTLQPPIVIHHPELLGPLNNTAIQALASAYIANIPPEPHPTDTRKYLIAQKAPVAPLLLKTFGTIFRCVGQVSVMWDKFQICGMFQNCETSFRPLGNGSNLWGRSVPALKSKIKVSS